MLELYADDVEANYQKKLRNPGPVPEQSFSMWATSKAPFTGLGTAAAQVGASVSEALDASLAPKDIDPGVDRGYTFGDLGKLLRRKSTEFSPDPQSAHVAESLTHGVFRFGGKAATAVGTMGPIAGGVALFAEETNTETRNLIDQGVDADTALKVGAVRGAVGAAGVLLPISGAALKIGTAGKVTATAGLVAVGGPGAYYGQETAAKTILQSSGYKDIADEIDPSDPLALALSTLIPSAFGAYALRRGAVRSTKVENGAIPLEKMSLTERQALKYDHPSLDAYAEQAAIKHGVPPELLLAIKNAGEKSGSKAVSPKGARGVMQFMPATAKEIGIKDPTDPIESIEGGAKYMRKLYDAYGSWDAATAHYNGGGTQAVLVRGGGKPSFKETAAYLDRVQKYVAERGVKLNPEIETAARVKLADETLTKNLPNHPDAIQALARVDETIEAGLPIETLEPQLGPIGLPDMSKFMADNSLSPKIEIEALPAKYNPFISWVKSVGGISYSNKLDITGEKGIKSNYAGIFTKKGVDLDNLALMARERGFLSSDQYESAMDNGGVNQLTDLIKRSIRGERIGTVEDTALSQEKALSQRYQSEAVDFMEKELRSFGVDPSPAKGDPDILGGYLLSNREYLVQKRIDDINLETETVRAEIQDVFGLTTEEMDSSVRIAMAMELDEFSVERAAIQSIDDVDFLNKIEDILSDGSNRGKITESSSGAEGNARVPAGDDATGRADAGILSAYDRSELQARAEKLKLTEAQQKRQDQDAERRARADAELDSFTLTGSNRVADVAAAQGQKDIFDTKSIDSLVKESPDMMVRLPGESEPMPLSKAMEKIKQEAEAEKRDADLFRVATECALINGQ